MKFTCINLSVNKLALHVVKILKGKVEKNKSKNNQRLQFSSIFSPTTCLILYISPMICFILMLSLLCSPFVILSIDYLMLTYPLISPFWILSCSLWYPLELILALWLLEKESFLWSSDFNLVISYFCCPFCYFRVIICYYAFLRFLLVTL